MLTAAVYRHRILSSSCHYCIHLLFCRKISQNTNMDVEKNYNAYLVISCIPMLLFSNHFSNFQCQGGVLEGTKKELQHT